MNNSERNYGLDLVRIFSMFGIIGLHITYNGGMLKVFEIQSFSYYVLLFFTTIFYTSVNTFAMLSGFLYVKKENVKYKNLVDLLVTVVFYCVVITVIFYAFNLYDVRNGGIKLLIGALCPPLKGRYWYITSYILLFLMIPYINRLIKNISQNELKKLLLILFILLSVVPTLGLLKDFFAIKEGYSPFWLIYCYMIGAYIRLFPVKNEKRAVAVFLGCIFVATSLNFALKWVGMEYLDRVVLSELFIGYISPFIVVAAASLIIIFKNISIKNVMGKKLVKLFASATFAVYIIHGHILIYDYVLKDLFLLMDYNIVEILLILAGSILAIYLLCSIIEVFRMKLFKLIRRDV